MKKDIRSIIIASAYLLCYCILLQFNSTRAISFVMLGFAPFVLVWMVYTVLKKGIYEGPELGKNEFGYSDKRNDELGGF